MSYVFAHTKANASTPESFASLRAAFDRHNITGRLQIATDHGLTSIDPSSEILLQLKTPTPEAFEAAHIAILEIFPDAIRQTIDDYERIPLVLVHHDFIEASQHRPGE